MSINKTIGIWVLVLAAITIALFVDSSFAANTVGGNYKNLTVPTKVTISNSNPEILAVRVFQESDPATPNITLNAGLTRNVTCNVSVRDWNGYQDVTVVNATLWHSSSSRFAADNNNSHYYTNCTNAGNGLNYSVNYLCRFPVYYYANNGTWNCSVMATDTYNKTGNNSNTTAIYPLYAINVTDGIDYGDVAVDDDSVTKTANITNFGNMAVNISLEGYAITRGDNLAMNCSIAGNIPIAYERFSLSDTGNWADKTPLTGSVQAISGLTMNKQTVAGTQVINATYWQLRIPPNPAGNCTGYVIFQAETP